ncbi:MAG: tRNA(Ile)-lysidine synthetase [Alphaproteobacteria bacterium]|nr:MAG: tRNA(Ile)-lysidine synthetase [Alphaproteobacteria bacterium]
MATGHTADDQAETFLMRLARGSGVAGLGAMSEIAPQADLVWLRPLLHERRSALRDFLRARGWDWIEDPSNDDPAFDRVKARQMLETLAPLGLSAERLAQTARHMRAAREVLDATERALAHDILEITRFGEARFDAEALARAPEAIASQFLADLLAAVGGAAYPPRLDAVERLAARLTSGAEGGTSLHGCIIRRRGALVILRREPARCTEVIPAANGALWDRRWRLRSLSDIAPGLTIGPLGLQGAASLEQRRPPAPAEVLATTPALRYGAELIAAPAAGLANGWSAEFELADRRRRWVFSPR